MSIRSRSSRWLVVATALFFASSCTDERGGAGSAPPSWEQVCIDVDGDGHGVQCAKGPDCDDADPLLTDSCAPCAKPAAGCECAASDEPVDCVVSRTFLEGGRLACSVGKLYCRSGVWSECIGSRSFEVPSPEVAFQQLGALIDNDAAPEICDVCSPDCYRVEDDLETVTNESGITLDPGGGLTLVSETKTVDEDPDEIDPDPPCTPGTIIPQFGQLDDDCDGIPDDFDDDPNNPPFATEHPAITMDLEPGESGSQTFELEFFLNTVDVYFLIDTTASMDGELNNLISDLTSGTFLDDPSTTSVDESASVVCASPPGTTTSDPTLKNKGIAGNIACLVPDSGFGAGFFREIPFNGSGGGIQHAYDWFIPYEHRQDISTTVDETLTALKKFPTAGNISWPEADIFALKAVATGEAVYTGWNRPGVPPRTCPDPVGQFGWPCFRREAIPVVVLITDAPMMNGPNVDVYNNANLASCDVDPWTFGQTRLGSCSSDSTCQTNYGASSDCTSNRCTCTTNAQCAAAYGTGFTCSNPGASGSCRCSADSQCQAYMGTSAAFCAAGLCVRENAISSSCAPDGVDDNYLGNDSVLNYYAAQTDDMAATPDGTYHPVSGNESFTSAHDVGNIGTSFVTYTGDTRAMTADVHLGNLGTACTNGKWPTSGNAAAVSSTTPGYPDAVFRFQVTDPNKTLTISTRGTHHAPTLAIIPVAAAGATPTTTVVNVPASGDSIPYSVSGSSLNSPFDYSVNLNMSSFTASLPRESFGTCMAGSSGTNTANDAVFSFTPATDIQGALFTTRSSRTVGENSTQANVSPGIDLGTVNGQTVIYGGTTTSSTTSKWTGSQVGNPGCREAASTQGKEHIFKFTVSNASAALRLRLNANFESVLSVFGPSSTAPMANATVPNYLQCSYVAGTSTSSDEIIDRTFAVGTYWVIVTGWQASRYGSYTLTIAEQSTSHEVIALYEEAPVTPLNMNITGPGGVANTNDVFYDFNVGQIDGNYLRLLGGDTNAVDGSGNPKIRADYMDSGFQAAGSACSVVEGTSNDAVIDFSVGTTRRVRIETFDGTGTSSTMGASFDHAVALIERPVQLSTVPVPVSNNDAPASAHVENASAVPIVEGGWLQLEGSTYGAPNSVSMAPNIQSQEMYSASNSATETCSAVSSSTQDAIFRFDVDAASAGYYDFDTIGSSVSTWLSVHKGSPDTYDAFTSPITASTIATDNGTANDTFIGPQTGVSLGQVDYKSYTYTGTTDTTTTNKWSGSELPGCRVTSSTALREHVFNFTLAESRPVRIELTRSGTTYDPVVSLLAAQPTVGASVTQLQACSRVGTATNANPAGLTSVSGGVITGTLAAGTYYVLVHAYQNTNNVGTYTLTVADNGRVPVTATTDNRTADGIGTIPGQPLLDAARGQILYTGAHTNSATDKWTAAQVNAGSGGSGCRASTTQNDGKEQLLSFTVSGSTARPLRIRLTVPSGTYDSVLSVFDTNGVTPVAGSDISGLMACSRLLTTTPGAVNEVISSGFTASAGTIRGVFAPGETYYLMVHAYGTSNPTGSYNIEITDEGYTDVTVTTNDTAAAGTSTNLQTGVDLGTLGRRLYYTGTVATGAADKWTQAEMSGGSGTGCRAAGNNTGNEHIVRFTVPTGSNRVLELQGARVGTTFDGSISVMSTQPNASGSPGSLQACSRMANAAVDQVVGGSFSVPGQGRIRGTFTAGQTYYVILHAYTANSAGAYTLTILDVEKQAGGSEAVAATYPRSIAATTATIAAGEYPTDPQSGVDLGVVDDKVVTYQGTTTTTDTLNKWYQTHVSRSSPAGGSTTGCRATTSNAAREHVLRFTVTEARPLTINLTRHSSSGTYDPVLSVFGAGPLQVAVPPGTPAVLPGASLLACTRAHNAAANYAISGYSVTSQGTISGTFAAGEYYVLVHANTTTNTTGTYVLTVTDASYSAQTSVATDALLANSSGPQEGVLLGEVDGRALEYTGTTDTTTTSKWTGGRVSTAASGFTGTGCRSSATNTTTREHLFQFTVTSPRRVAIRATRSATTFDPVVSLFNGSVPYPAQNVGGLMGCTRVASTTPGNDHQTIDTTSLTSSFNGFITGTLAAGTYYVMVHAYSASNATGTFTLNVSDVTPFNLGTATGRRLQVTGSNVGFPNQWTGANLAGSPYTGNGSRQASTARSREMVYSFNVTTTQSLTVATVSGSLDAVISVFDQVPYGNGNVSGFLQSHRNSGGYETITRTFAPGTYYVVVHGYQSTSTGSYTLEVRDNTWDDGLLGCDSYLSESAVKNVNFEAGNSYYVVVKGGVGPSNYGYKLNVRRSFNRPFIACDYQTLGTRRGAIEAELIGGKTYSVVVRGRTASDAGTYGVIIRDLSVATTPLGCANSAGYTGSPSDPSSFTANLEGGKTYYVAVRSNSSGSVGHANVSVQSSAATCEYDNVALSTSMSNYMPAELVRKFPVGDYYAVIKGRSDLDTSSIGIPTGSGDVSDDRGRGWYQITFGDASLQSVNQTFSPPAWGTETSGVYADLVSKGIRVITVDSTPSTAGNTGNNAADRYLRAQSIEVSTDTGALDTTGAAIRRTIQPDGNGMGFAIVDAIAKFTEAVQMDISVRLTLSPDDPGLVAPYNKRFEFVARAIPVAGNNGCAPPIDTDGNGVLDTFEACGPGATPRFEVKITNPASPNHVRPNPDDPGGGYLMTLQLIGKDRLVSTAQAQIIDEIPVYIIPANVLPDPEIEFEPSGTYTQTVSSTGCSGTMERPIWRGLYWSDSLPVGTSMEWRVCGGDTDAELAACSSGGFKTVATVASSNDTCAVSSDCELGYCNEGRCSYPIGPSCVTSSECGRQGTCSAGRCRWNSDPATDSIDLKPAISDGYVNKKRMRVQVELTSNAARDKAPTIHDYRLDYVCVQYE